MNRLLLGMLIGAVALGATFLLVTSAAAQGTCCLEPTQGCTTAADCDAGPCGPPCFDHLKCYKVKDPLKLKGVVDINTPQFGAELGCKVGKARMFCVPANKQVQEAFNKKAPIIPAPVPGPELQEDRLCYKIKCPKPFPPGPTVTDQFGVRPLEKLKPLNLCTPAYKGSDPSAPPPTANDHMKCYRVKDPIKLKGIVDLDSAQFGLEPGCKIRSAKLFCVPGTKTVVSASASKQDLTILPIGGFPLQTDHICYTIKCAEPFPPDQQVTDQFGTRTIEKLKPFMLCTPAFKDEPTTTTMLTTTTTTTTMTVVPPPTTTTTMMMGKPPCEMAVPPECEGWCPEPTPAPANQACLPVGPGGTCECRTFSPEPPCGTLAGAPLCHGVCPQPMACVAGGPPPAPECVCSAD